MAGAGETDSQIRSRRTRCFSSLQFRARRAPERRHPRPERPGFVQRYLQEVPGYAERFSLAPGLTGLAQVNGDYHSTPQNKLRYELAYMANWTVWLDLSILLRTVKIVLTSRGV